MTPEIKQKILDLAVEYFYDPEVGMCFALSRMRKVGATDWSTYQTMLKEVKQFSNSLLKDVKGRHPNSTHEQHINRCYRIYNNWGHREKLFYEDEINPTENEAVSEEVSYRTNFTPLGG